MAKTGLPDKPYYRIGEVARHLGVPTHVLRYWESEMPQIEPRRSPSGHRIFLPDDVRLLEMVRQMTQEEGYTLAGVQRRLSQTEDAKITPQEQTSRPKAEIITELKDILKMLG